LGLVMGPRPSIFQTSEEYSPRDPALLTDHWGKMQAETTTLEFLALTHKIKCKDISMLASGQTRHPLRVAVLT